MPKTIEPDGVQLWYTSFAKEPENLSARITLVDGKTFKSPPYSKLQGFMDPLDPVAGHGLL